MFALLDD